MKTVNTFARQFSFSLMMAMTLGSAVVSCDSILGEEEVDCSVEYRVKFKYDYNMKYADAFSREVGTVTLYAFDDNGKLGISEDRRRRCAGRRRIYHESGFGTG